MLVLHCKTGLEKYLGGNKNKLSTTGPSSYSLLIVAPIVGFRNCSMFCCALLCVHSSFAIILMGKRVLDALLCLSSWYLVIVV